jgi:serine protease Do
MGKLNSKKHSSGEQKNMTKRSATAAVILLGVGILLGAVVVSGFGGSILHALTGSTRFMSEPLYDPPESVVKLNETFTEVARIVTPSVVYITVKAKVEANLPQNFWPFGDMYPRQDEDQLQEGSGSGIIITSDGYILTNRHVIKNATEDGIAVTLSDSRKLPAKLVGSDEYTDIAVIKVNAKDLQPASIGNSDNVKVGQWVMAVGNPLGLTSTVTTGIVSAISRNINISEKRDGSGIENFIQTDAAINPGNSGGALVDLRAQVIGVNTAIASRTGNYIGYGFAVPINLARVVADAIIKEGKFSRGYIGVNITNLDAKKAKALGLDRYNGVIVESVQDDGAGKAAGIEAGDVIVEIEGREVASASELQARVGMHKPGDVISVKLWRNGEYMTKSVTLKAREGDDNDDANSKKSIAEDESSNTKSPQKFDKVGFTVRPLDEAASKTFKRKTGVLVTDVKQYGQAFDNNLRPNVVIFEARKQRETISINKVSDMKKVLGDLKEGESILLRVQDADGRTYFVPIEGPAD